MARAPAQAVVEQLLADATDDSEEMRCHTTNLDSRERAHVTTDQVVVVAVAVVDRAVGEGADAVGERGAEMPA
ncbi:MAG: hypothetical protein KDB31_12365 [Microthrixaceae bacterium]|nr:hypothetical protein [Microthrixaceae bacterium]